ncbi:hypothetical protein ACEPAI_9487 [Sanghuangporus weigelae]
MFAADSQPHVIKGDLLDIDFTMDMDHRKRRRNRTTQSCLNCHTSKRKCDRKRPCQRCIQLGLTGLCVYEVDDPALRDDPDLDETTRLRNRIAELESLVRELRGKPHPRWADPNYYDGDASDKWHTRSQKRGNAAAAVALAKQRRPQSPHLATPIIKTEPVADVQHAHCYYRLSPSPPPSATSTTYSMNIGQMQSNQYGTNAYQTTCANGTNGAAGYSPGTYSPSSSSSSGLNGHSPNGIYSYEDSCACVSDPAANHSFVALARQLEGMTSYLQQLPGHSQTRCSIYRHIQNLKGSLHGDSSSEPTLATSYTSYDGHTSEALRSPVETDLMTPLTTISTSVPMSGPPTPHSMHMLQWGTDNNAHHNGHVSAYFTNADVYAKGVGAYDVVS